MITTYGCLPDSPDPRDFRVQQLGALPPADFSKGSGLPRPPLHDQGSSDACVSYASSYLHWQVHHPSDSDYSRRDLFARIAQVYGAYLRDGVKAICGQGQALKSVVPDPQNPDPQNMRDTSGVTAANENAGLEANYFVLPGDIDTVAAAILAYKGVVFGVWGTNEGWANPTDPNPPTQEELNSGQVWGHALYGVDYHIHSDGQKCIIAVTSWPNIGIQEHHIRASYFNDNTTFNPWVLIPKENLPMNQAKIVKSKNSSQVWVCYPAGDMAYLSEKANIEGIAFDKNNIPNTDSLG